MTDVDFSVYQPPGVYVEETDTATVPVVGVPPTVIALVGVAVGYQQNTEQITLDDSVPVVFSQLGVIGASVVVVRADTGATVVSGDYTLANPTGSPETNQNYTTSIVLSEGSTTSEGTVVFVSYNYQTPSYFTPQAFTSFEDVKAFYGEPVNLTPQTPGDTSYQAILSPLSLAAQIAFLQNAGSLVTVAVPAPTGGSAGSRSTALRNNIAAGYALIASNYDVNVVIPVTYTILDADAEGAALDLKNHVETCSADGFYRIGFIGFDPPPTGDVNTASNVIATAIADQRVILVAGSGQGVSYYNGQANQYLTLGDGYLAVACGGELATQQVQMPLTMKYIDGFKQLVGQPLSTAAKNVLSNAGVCVIQPDRYGNLQVRHGTTTLRTNVNTREISLIRAKDAMLEVVQSGVEQSGLIGSPVTATTLTSIQATVTSMLELCVTTGVILGYQNVTVTQTSVDPSVVTVTFAYQPAYPLNYIVISFTINVATGATALATAA